MIAVLVRFFGSFGAIFVLMTVVLSPVAYAEFDPLEQACSGSGSASSACAESKKGTSDPITGDDGILKKAIELLSVVVGIASVIVIVIAGMTMTLSSGDASRVKSSRDAIIYAAVGLVVVALSRAAVLLIASLA